MTRKTNLEGRYRRLLAWYPRAFRQENGPEILGVLMAGTRDGQRRPGLAESADLIRSGLWMRLRPGVPRSAPTVRAAVGSMYAGAAVSTANLVIMLALIANIKARHALLGHRLSAAAVSQLTAAVITVEIVLGLVPVIVWLWMARASGQGRNWARVLSTVLFGLATLSLSSLFPQQVLHISFVPTAQVTFLPLLGPAVLVLTWLAAAAAVWLLWRPASGPFFQPPGHAQATHQAQAAEREHQAQLAEVARIRARQPRQA